MQVVRDTIADWWVKTKVDMSFEDVEDLVETVEILVMAGVRAGEMETARVAGRMLAERVERERRSLEELTRKYVRKRCSCCGKIRKIVSDIDSPIPGMERFRLCQEDYSQSFEVA